MLGFDAETQQAAPNTNAMISMLTDNLGVDAAQASGGLGSLFNYVKGNVSADQFGQLSEALPGVSELIGINARYQSARAIGWIKRTYG